MDYSTKIDVIYKIINKIGSVSTNIKDELIRQKNLSFIDLLELNKTDNNIQLYKFIQTYQTDKIEFIKNIATLIGKELHNDTDLQNTLSTISKEKNKVQVQDKQVSQVTDMQVKQKKVSQVPETLEHDITKCNIYDDKYLLIYKLTDFIEDFDEPIFWRTDSTQERKTGVFSPINGAYYAEVSFNRIRDNTDFKYYQEFIDKIYTIELRNCNNYVNKKTNSYQKPYIELYFYYYRKCKVLMITSTSFEKMKHAYDYFTDLKYDILNELEQRHNKRVRR